MYTGKIAAVSYLNTVPMIYGIESSNLGSSLLLSPPSGCARAFMEGRADVALVPVGSLGMLSAARVVTDYCIGADASVRTVVLMSDSPVGEIRRVWLDSHSMTSVALCRLLAREYWGIEPEWCELSDYSVMDAPAAGDAFLVIGDKVFGHEGRFAYSYDMADCWRGLTGLPFVFAVWVAREGVDDGFVARLSSALTYGTDHIAEAIERYGHADKPYAYDYLTRNISFRLDEAKRRALYLFLKGIYE